jgi:hypothetical protein
VSLPVLCIPVVSKSRPVPTFSSSPPVSPYPTREEDPTLTIGARRVHRSWIYVSRKFGRDA